MPDASDPDLATVLARLTTEEATTFLNTGVGPVDWPGAPGRVVLPTAPASSSSGSAARCGSSGSTAACSSSTSAGATGCAASPRS